MSIWIDEGARQTPEWAAVSEAGNVCVERLEETTKLLGEAVEKLNEVAPQQGADLTESGGFLGNLLAGIRLICAGEDTSYVYSAQLSRSRRRIGQEKLCAEKIDVGADLASRWLPEMQSVVFTSATIAVGDDFSHFDHAVGLDLLPSGEHGREVVASLGILPETCEVEYVDRTPAHEPTEHVTTVTEGDETAPIDVPTRGEVTSGLEEVQTDAARTAGFGLVMKSCLENMRTQN